MKLFKYVVIAFAALALTLSGCAVEKPAAVKEEPTKKSSGSSPATEDSEVMVDEAAAEEPEAEPETPEVATLADTMIVGDWEVKVSEFAKNANAAIAQANMFNEKPKSQYVMVTYEATYTGSERTADVMMDLTWTLTTSDQQIHETSYMVTPADNQSWPTTARRGGTVKYQITFDVKPSLIKGGILSVEGYDADFNTVYADFAL